jgi:pantoate kinase
MRAYCPGHITGFFTIEDSEEDPLMCGSRGVGFCVGVGATADVTVEPSDSPVSDITINGEHSDAPVTKLGIGRLLAGENWYIKANIVTMGPIGQGLGMSAAGTFATCLAIADELNLPDGRSAALQATHVAEVSLKTGLGDAVAQDVGGLVHRIKPGIPPFGEVNRIDWPLDDVVICVLGQPLSTPSIITSEVRKRTISDAGSRCLKEFQESPDFPTFLKLSMRFANETGLISSPVKDALDSITDVGEGNMIMLGNSIFAFGNTDKIAEGLDKFGCVLKTNISDEGVKRI